MHLCLRYGGGWAPPVGRVEHKFENNSRGSRSQPSTLLTLADAILISAEILLYLYWALR
jgi:hypothetical protein